MAADMILIPVQPSPYDIWAADEVVKLIEDARVFKETLLSYFVINRKITNTAIGRDSVEALAAYSIPVLSSAVVQRIIFAESAAQGKAVYEIDEEGPAAVEIELLKDEITKEFLR